MSSTDEDELRVDFYAARDIAADEELTFDYGVRYWLWRDAPSADSDSRNFSEPKYRDLRPVEKTLLHPPPVGTVLPLTPLTAEELQAALALPEIDGPHGHRAALLRCLDYLGRRGQTAVRSTCRSASATPPSGGRCRRPARRHDAGGGEACVMEAVVDPADASGAASAAFESGPPTPTPSSAPSGAGARARRGLRAVATTPPRSPPICYGRIRRRTA